MGLFQNEILANYPKAYQDKFKSVVNRQILTKIFVSSWVVVPLFFAILYSTPLFRRFPRESVALAVVYCLLILGFLLCHYLQSRGRLKGRAGEILQWACHFAVVALWGLFSAWIMFEFRLSWTTFFVTLISLALTASQVLIFAPNKLLFFSNLTLLAAPSMISCFAAIRGESGAAIGIFLAVYMFFIWQIGKAQNTVFWQNLVESSRLDAIIQSIPGSLAWYNSDLKYIGYNPKHKALWKFTDDQTGQSLLQNGLGESLKSLVGDVFKSESEVRTIQKIDKQTYYLIGKQYSYGGEALLMGIDVSSQHTVQNELERSRNTIVHSSRYLEIGEIFRVLLKNGVPFDYLDSLLGSLTMGKDADAQKISSMEIVSEINRLFGKACENLKIELKFSQQESFTAHMQKSEIILALSSLLLNSLDILKSVENPEILVSTKVDGGTGIFAIRDNGPEVDEVFRDIIFEPFFSTDDAHSGMGLSLVKEIAHNHKGELTLKEGKEFQIRVPVQHS